MASDDDYKKYHWMLFLVAIIHYLLCMVSGIFFAVALYPFAHWKRCSGGTLTMLINTMMFPLIWIGMILYSVLQIIGILDTFKGKVNPWIFIVCGSVSSEELKRMGSYDERTRTYEKYPSFSFLCFTVMGLESKWKEYSIC